MSNSLVTLVYSRKMGSPTRKALMALMADKGHDDGSGIFASKQTLADELDCSRRVVFEKVAELVKDGLLRDLGQRKVATGYTVEYQIIIEAVEALPLVAAHQRRAERVAASENEPDQCTTRTSAPDALVQEAHPTSAPRAPKPSLNLSSEANASSERAGAVAKPKRAKATEPPPDLPDWVPKDAWDGFVAMRAGLRKRPTPRAAELLIANLAKLREQGFDPAEVLNQSTMNSYLGLFPLKASGGPRAPPDTGVNFDHIRDRYQNRRITQIGSTDGRH